MVEEAQLGQEQAEALYEDLNQIAQGERYNEISLDSEDLQEAEYFQIDLDDQEEWTEFQANGYPLGEMGTPEQLEDHSLVDTDQYDDDSIIVNLERGVQYELEEDELHAFGVNNGRGSELGPEFVHAWMDEDDQVQTETEEEYPTSSGVSPMHFVQWLDDEGTVNVLGLGYESEVQEGPRNPLSGLEGL